MAWITTISYSEATGKLKTLYDRIKGPNNNVDNIMMAHSLRPHTMEGHMTLYKYVLHHPHNKLDKWLLEAIGTYVSIVNNCHYCIEHHYAGLKRLLDDDAKSEAIRAAFHAGDLTLASEYLSERDRVGLTYAAILTASPTSLTKGNISTLREAGYDDGEILEINQVTAYFAYANRTVLGLGINTDGDIMGLSPGDNSDPESWAMPNLSNKKGSRRSLDHVW